jgi:hypothetical protein
MKWQRMAKALADEARYDATGYRNFAVFCCENSVNSEEPALICVPRASPPSQMGTWLGKTNGLGAKHSLGFCYFIDFVARAPRLFAFQGGCQSPTAKESVGIMKGPSASSLVFPSALTLLTAIVATARS